jgi:hypothetical protein
MTSDDKRHWPDFARIRTGHQHSSLKQLPPPLFCFAKASQKPAMADTETKNILKALYLTSFQNVFCCLMILNDNESAAAISMTINDNSPAAEISMTPNDNRFSILSYSKAAKIGTFRAFLLFQLR